MAMNEVNPLSFIRRVIPDTAAKTNAETFKQKAALGLQNNKQAAAMAQALREIAGRKVTANLGQGMAGNTTDADAAGILGNQRKIKAFKDRAVALNDMRGAGFQSSTPSGGTVKDMANPINGFNHVLLKGVSAALAAKQKDSTKC